VNGFASPSTSLFSQSPARGTDFQTRTTKRQNEQENKKKITEDSQTDSSENTKTKET